MWLLDGVLNFALYLGIPLSLLTLLAGLAWLRWRRHLLLVAFVPLLAWAGLLALGTSFLAHEQACDVTSGIRVATVNVMVNNPDLGKLADNVLGERPDVVVFEELNRDLATFSPELDAAYPFRLSTAIPWVTLASRFPLEDPTRLALPADAADAAGREPLAATVSVNGQQVRLLAVHAIVPRNGADYSSHGQQYDLIAEATRTSPMPVLAIGDFNATMSSPAFLRLLVNGGLRVATNEWWQTSTHFPRPHLGLRIDHVLVRGLDVCGEQTFQLAGSDHVGVRAWVNLRAPLAGLVSADGTGRSAAN